MQIKFTAARGFCVENAISAQLQGDELTVSLWYDSHEEPLRLRAKCDPADRATLVLRPYRV